jgi:hypothetical protein
MQKAMSLLKGPLAELRQKGPSATVARAVAKAAQEIRARRESGLSREGAKRGARRA